MAIRAICIALLLSTLPIAGCGTVSNLVMVHPDEGGKSPFGGVRHDVSRIKTQAESKECQQIATRVLYTADLPFTFIGDVVTWPYTASYSYINSPVPVPPLIPPPQGPIQPVPPATLGLPSTYPMETLPVPKELPLPEPGK